MKKIMFLLFFAGVYCQAQAQEVLITGYVDSPCPDANGRTIEIYVNGTIDFTGWNIVRQSNGDGYTTNIDLSALGTLTDEFAYVTNDSATLETEFGINATTNSIIENGSINDNGNDAFQIIDDVAGVIDRFGEDEVDGSGTNWEHTDSYYYRDNGSTPNAGTFDAANWTFGALDILDEEGICNTGSALSTLVPFGSFLQTSPETCSLLTTSFTESFDAEIPECWTVVNNDGGDYTWGYDTAHPQSGTGHLTLHWEDSAHDDYLISPQFTVTSGTTDQVSFYAGGTGTTYPETFDVKLSITGTSPADFTELLGSETTTADVDGGAGYDVFTYDMSAYDGQDVYIAIVGTSTNEFYLYLDEFSVSTPPSCPQPTDLTVENITPSSADFTWIDGGSEWEVLYGTTGFDPLTEGTAIADNDGTLGVSISVLDPNTEYDVYVKTICGAGDESEWTGPETFTTLALPPANDECSDAISITVNTDATCTLFTVGTNTGATTSSQTDDVVGTPNNDVWFTFVATATTHIISLSNVTAEIGTSVDMAIGLYDGSAGCGALAFEDDSDSNSFEAAGLTVGTTYYLRVYGWSTAQASFDLCVTTVPEVPENDACADAIEVSIFPYTNSQNAASATNNDGFIDVDDCGSANDGVWYTIIGDGGEITVEVTETSSWDSKLGIFTGSCGSFVCVDNIDTGNDVETLTFLSSVGTIYYVNIAHYSGFSDSPEGSFDIEITTTGLITCLEPTDITVESIISDSADITWMAGQDEEEWEVLYGLSGFDPITAGTSIADNDGTLGVNISGLDPETGYDVYVKAICSVGDESEWAGPETFTTAIETVIVSETTPVLNETYCYGNSDFKEWSFQSDNGNPLIITFNAGTMEDNSFSGETYDDLVIYDGVDNTGMEIFNSDTDGFDLTGLTFTAASGNLYMTLSSDGSTSCSSGSETQIDFNVEVGDAITCPIPTGLTMDNIGFDSADVTWTAGEDEEEWEVLYGLSGFDPFTAGTSIADNDGTLGVNISGLDPETEYDVYVKAICGVGDESEWSGPETFTTAIETVIVSETTPVLNETYCYENSDLKEWSFQSDNGNPLIITFIAGTMEDNSFSGGTYDDLVIYDGVDNTGMEIFNSDTDGFDLTGLTFTAASGNLYMTLSSDGSTSCSSGSETQIDFNVEVGDAITCPIPTGLTVDNIGFDSADVTWTAGEDEEEWEVLYGLSDFDPLTEGTSIADNDGTLGVNISGLDTDTEYDVYVKAICGVGDESEWVGPFTFNTPYCQVEFGFTVEPITLVEIANISNSTDPLIDGTPSVEDYTDTTIEVDQGGAYEIYLEGNTGGSSYINYFTVFVDWNQNGILNDIGEVYEIGSITGSDGMDGQQASGTIDVPEDAMLGATRFRVYKNYNASVIDPCEANGWGQIEDYTINVSLPCADPSALTEVETTMDSIEIMWTENGTATSWEIIYGPSGFDPMTEGSTELDNDGTPQYIIIGLDPNTTYDVYIQAICTGGESELLGPGTYTTLPIPCSSPTDIVIGEISNTSAEISWTENGTAVEWEIEYGETGFTQGNGTIVADNDGTLGETITSLLPGTSYDVYVRSICTGNESNWTGPEDFMTDLGVLDEVFEGFIYYPNPISSQLSLKATNEIEQVVIYNLLGQEVLKDKPNSLRSTLNLSNLQAGTYLMKVTINGSTEIFRIIKE